MALTFTGLKLQGALGRFGKTALTDIEGYVELPDGKVRNILAFSHASLSRQYIQPYSVLFVLVLIQNGRNYQEF